MPPLYRNLILSHRALPWIPRKLDDGDSSWVLGGEKTKSQGILVLAESSQDSCLTAQSALATYSYAAGISTETPSHQRSPVGFHQTGLEL